MSRKLRLSACAIVLSASTSLSGCALDVCIGCINCVSCLLGGPSLPTPITAEVGEIDMPVEAPRSAEYAAVSY